MTEPTRPEIGLGVCRSGVEACTDRSIEAIDAAVARCDYELAATIALARAKAGEPVPIAVACKILPGIELPAIVNALIAIATGDRSELMTILEHRRFPQTRENGELEAIVLYAAHRGGTPRERLIPELRRLAARTMFADGYALLAAIARDLDHPNVTMAVKQIASFADEYAKEVVATGKAHAASVTDVLAALPPNVQAAAGAVGFTVRAEKEPGRNDPCPCGSGLKYKKCHADKPVEAGSPIAGVSWEAFLTTSADQMTVDHVKALPLKELARTHLDRLAVPAHVEAIRQFAAAHEWTHAARALDALVPKDAKWADDARDMAIHEAQWCREHAFARAQIAQLSPDLAALFQLELAVEERPETRFAELVTAAEQAIRSDDRVAYVDLAYNLLRAAPPLGILAARACIGAWKIDDPQALLDSVEEIRDQLDLPPGDPAWDVVDAIAAKRPKRRGAAESDESVALRSTLAESAARADELERSLAAIRAQLDDARTLPAAELQRKTENRTALESKISELEGLIREGNAERRELRKQLTASQNDDDAKPAAPEKESDDGGEDLPETARGITIPRFDRRFIDSLEAIPQAVGAEAMRTIGTLSAGDGFAWLGVKQAKDMARQVLMARVGIHHRLLFRADAGILDVLDLVTRETLLATLKRMRANKT